MPAKFLRQLAVAMLELQPRTAGTRHITLADRHGVRIAVFGNQNPRHTMLRLLGAETLQRARQKIVAVARGDHHGCRLAAAWPYSDVAIQTLSITREIISPDRIKEIEPAFGRRKVLSLIGVRPVGVRPTKGPFVSAFGTKIGSLNRFSRLRRSCLTAAKASACAPSASPLPRA
jgi:hypothetical protein